MRSPTEGTPQSKAPRRVRASTTLLPLLTALGLAGCGGSTPSPGLLNSDGGKFQVRPATVILAGDGSGLLGGPEGTGQKGSFGHVTWTSWGSTSATGTGALWVNNCEPNCAQGTFSPATVSITAHSPQAGHFTRLSLKYEEHGDTVADEREIHYNPGATASQGSYDYETPTATPEDFSGPASFLGTASNGLIFVQWTRDGDNVSGSARESLQKSLRGSGVTPSGTPFTGIISGNGVTLHLEGNESWVGTIAGSTMSLNVPGDSGGLITVYFRPAEANEYDEQLEKLRISEYSSPCELAVPGHEARIQFSGPEAPAQCAHFVQRSRAVLETEWTSEVPPRGGETVVCQLTNRANETAIVHDGGGLAYGSAACKMLSGEGWG